jgi:hypothetical protein
VIAAIIGVDSRCYICAQPTAFDRSCLVVQVYFIYMAGLFYCLHFLVLLIEGVTSFRNICAA